MTIIKFLIENHTSIQCTNVIHYLSFYMHTYICTYTFLFITNQRSNSIQKFSIETKYFTHSFSLKLILVMDFCGSGILLCICTYIQKTLVYCQLYYISGFICDFDLINSFDRDDQTIWYMYEYVCMYMGSRICFIMTKMMINF